MGILYDPYPGLDGWAAGLVERDMFLFEQKATSSKMEKNISYAKECIANRAFWAAFDFVPEDIVGLQDVESGRCLVFLQKDTVLHIPVQYEERWDGSILHMKCTSPGVIMWAPWLVALVEPNGEIKTGDLYGEEIREYINAHLGQGDFVEV